MMPVARFEMPDGKIARFEVAEGTTPEQAQNQIAQMVSQQDIQQVAEQPSQVPLEVSSGTQPEPLPEGTALQSFTEPATALATGLGGQIVSGLAAAGAAPFVGGERAGEIATDIQRSAAELGAPETQAGQRGLEKVGEAFEEVADVIQFPVSGLAGLAELISGQSLEQATKTIKDVQEKGIGKTAGDRTFELTGSPLMASVAESSPEIIASIIPVTKIAKSRNALQTKLSDNLKLSTAQPELANQIRTISSDISTGKIPRIDAPKALTLLENEVRAKSGGIPANKMLQVIEDVKGGRVEQLSRLEKIADDVEVAEPQKSLALFIQKGSAKVKKDALAKEAVRQGFDQGVLAAVKGASSTDRIKMARMVSIMKRGKENAIFATKNRPSDVAGQSLLQRVNHVKRVNRNAGKRLDSVAKSLKGKEIDSSLPINNFLSNLDDMGISIGDDLKPIFRGSDIEGLAAPENAVKNIVKRLASGKLGGTPDAFELHRMKRFIDEVVTYGKVGEGLAGKTERILKQLRADLDRTLDSTFPRYDKVNTRYSDTVGALDALQDVAGKKMDLFGPNAEKATGTLLRRMMSNAQSRVNLVDAVDSLEAISKKYGGNFTDDIATQMLFADELDSVFGAVAKTSLQGDVIKGVKTGVERAAGGRGAIETVLSAAELGTKKLRGISEEKAFQTIEKILSRRK